MVGELQVEAALVEEDRLGDTYRASMGTSSEMPAYYRLQVASQDVAAHQAALKLIDDDELGGRLWVNGR